MLDKLKEACYNIREVKGKQTLKLETVDSDSQEKKLKNLLTNSKEHDTINTQGKKSNKVLTLEREKKT